MNLYHATPKGMKPRKPTGGEQVTVTVKNTGADHVSIRLSDNLSVHLKVGDFVSWTSGMTGDPANVKINEVI